MFHMGTLIDLLILCLLIFVFVDLSVCVSTASSDTYVTYQNWNCTRAATTGTDSVGTCTAWPQGNNAASKQTCTALFPTATPTSAPSGPSNRPTAAPTTAVFLPVAGAVYTGYMLEVSCDPRTGFKAATVTQLGKCIPTGNTGGSVFVYWMPATSTSSGHYVVNWYYNDVIYNALSNSYTVYPGDTSCPAGSWGG